MTQNNFDNTVVPTEFAADKPGDVQKNAGRLPPEALIRSALARAGVLAMRLIGPPGSGKTELIEATLKAYPAPRRVAVIAVDPASVREADRLKKRCGHVAHLDSPVPDPASIWRIVSNLDLDSLDFLIIEGCGGMGALKDIGQDATVAVLAVSGGDDKALEYRALLERASVILLTKIDVRQLVKFNDEVFHGDAKAIAPDAEVIELSAVTGVGMHRWLQWLDQARTAKKWRDVPRDPEQTTANTYFG
ncbi:MAG TPA: GTP-binding protein [Tepidisphaeraceae bacterium]|jgi:hydrogenase nickel incorporation protein HypB